MATIIAVTEELLLQAGYVHAQSWRTSHRGICSPAFVEAHTAQRQAAYLRGERAAGKSLWLLLDPDPVGMVSVDGSLIENLYVLPERQGRGYGTLLLDHALQQCREIPRLSVLSSNERALTWYLRRGFRETDRHTLRDGLAEIHMTLAPQRGKNTGGIKA